MAELTPSQNWVVQLTRHPQTDTYDGEDRRYYRAGADKNHQHPNASRLAVLHFKRSALESVHYTALVRASAMSSRSVAECETTSAAKCSCARVDYSGI